MDIRAFLPFQLNFEKSHWSRRQWPKSGWIDESSTTTTKTSTKKIDSSVGCKSLPSFAAPSITFSFRRHLEKTSLIKKIGWKVTKSWNSMVRSSTVYEKVTESNRIIGHKLSLAAMEIRNLKQLEDSLAPKISVSRKIIFIFAPNFPLPSIFPNRKIRGMKKTRWRFHYKVSLWLQQRQQRQQSNRSAPLSIWFADNKFFRQK